MNTQPKPTPLIIGLMSYLPLAEKIFLMSLAVGIMLTLANMDTMVTKISLLGLAVTFFLSAYKVIDVPRKENEVYDFPELLGLTIAPKIMWISCAVSVTGALLLMSNTGNEGYKQMFFIGGSTLAVGSTILFYLMVTGVKNIGIVVPVLYRAIPLLGLDLYLFFK